MSAPATCCRCKRETTAPVAVRHIQTASGPGITLHACPDCAPELTPGPLPDETAAPHGDEEGSA